MLDSWVRHNNNVSLWLKSGLDIRLVAYWPIERFSGWRRHGSGVPDEAAADELMASLLAVENVGMGEVMEFWGTPGVGGDRYVDVTIYFKEDDLPPHSLAHVFSCALLDTDIAWSEPVLALAIDGGPDSDSFLAVKNHSSVSAGAYLKSGEFTWFPVESPARLFTAARRRFGLREGQLMQLASAADCDPDLETLRREALAALPFSGPAARLMAECERFVGVLEEAATEALANGSCAGDARFTVREQVISAVMKEIQRISLAVMERNVDQACARFEIDPAGVSLALAGGFALNCPTNSALMARYGFRRLLAPPCVDDSGQSLGIALGVFYRRCGPSGFAFRFPSAYLGYRDRDLAGALAAFGGHIGEVTSATPARAAADLLAGPVAWVDGRAELGPRALGHRSILADPTRLASRDRLNQIKQREWWRPIAPVIREEDTADWFDDARPSPYMLETFTVRADRQHKIPAIAHLDRSARIQTLRRDQDPFLYDVITAFAANNGVPLLCNTSLNDRGEPIIDTVAQAIDFCLRKDLPVAYINQHRVTLTGHAAYRTDGPLPRTTGPFDRVPCTVADLTARLNPTDLDDLYLHVWLRYPLLRRTYNPADPHSARTLKKTIDNLLAMDPELGRSFAEWIRHSHNPRTRAD